MQASIAAARSAVRTIVDYVLPARCAGCGAVVEDVHRFCLSCWQQLHFLGNPCCARCGFPFEYESGPGAECGACIASPPEYDRMRAAVAYGDIARRVVLKLKYGGRPGVAATLAHFMQRHLPQDGDDALLVPVPLHRWRIWRRGYNQSALIATELARRSGLALSLDLLQRTRATPVLKGLGRRERALAVRGAFRVREDRRELVRGRTVILVDDVYTSGATANACARILRKEGAASVNILCWARVVRGSD